MAVGTVLFVDKGKKFGFVVSDMGTEKVLLDHNSFSSFGFNALEEGQRISYTEVPFRSRISNFRATNVKLVSPFTLFNPLDPSVDFSSEEPLGFLEDSILGFPEDNPEDFPLDFPEDNPEESILGFPEDNPDDFPLDFPEDNPEDFPMDFPVFDEPLFDSMENTYPHLQNLDSISVEVLNSAVVNILLGLQWTLLASKPYLVFKDTRTFSSQVVVHVLHSACPDYDSDLIAKILGLRLLTHSDAGVVISNRLFTESEKSLALAWDIKLLGRDNLIGMLLGHASKSVYNLI